MIDFAARHSLRSRRVHSGFGKCSLHRNALVSENDDVLEPCWGVQPDRLIDGASLSAIAKPESAYPETTAFKSTRPSGSGDIEQNSTGHSYSGFALRMRQIGRAHV